MCFHILLRTQSFLSLSSIKSGMNSEVRLAIREGLDGRGDRIPVRASFPPPFKTGPGTHLGSCTISTGSLSRG